MVLHCKSLSRNDRVDFNQDLLAQTLTSSKTNAVSVAMQAERALTESCQMSDETRCPMSDASCQPKVSLGMLLKRWRLRKKMLEDAQEQELPTGITAMCPVPDLFESKRAWERKVFIYRETVRSVASQKN